MPCDLPLMCDSLVECRKECMSFAADRGVELSCATALTMCSACYSWHRCSDGHMRLRRRDVSAEAVLLVVSELGGVLIAAESPSDLTRECCQTPKQEPLPWYRPSQDTLPGC